MRLEVKNLQVVLGGKRIIRDLSFALPSGSALAVVGPSGAGKTSLLRVLAGLLQPANGQVFWDGKQPDQFYGSAQLAFLFQEACLCPHLTLRQNLELIYWAHRRAPDPAQIDRQLAVVGLAVTAQLYPHEASVGMKARTAIARMLCLQPRAVLMDEPFAALDPVRRAELNQVVSDRRRDLGATTVWISHDVVETLMFADFVLGLDARGEARWYDLAGLPQVTDAGALPEAARGMRDRIIRECMEEVA